MPRPEPLHTHPAEVARSLALDGMAADVIGLLEAAGVRAPILLKGASLACWLYGDGAHRPYVDVDLLIDPADEDRASEALRHAGFSRRSREFQHGPAPHAIAWRRVGAPGSVDLHTTLVGSRVDRVRTVEILRSRTEPFELAGRTVLVLEPSARAFHVVLHAAQDRHQHGKKLEDLRRVLALPTSLWDEVLELTEQLRAGSALRAGLEQLPEGGAMAQRLGVHDIDDIEVLLRASGESQAAALSEHLRSLPTWSNRARYLVERMWPRRSVIDPDRRRSWPWSVRVRVLRLLSLIRRAPRAIGARRKARRRLG